MPNYIKALQEGFEAAKKADLARTEIRQVLEQFTKDVLAGSDGKLLIEVKTFEEQQSPFEFAKISALGVIEKKYYDALVASNPKRPDRRKKELARWKQANEGYPCSLTIQHREIQMEDRAALERGLAELLKSPLIGEVLYSLIKDAE